MTTRVFRMGSRTGGKTMEGVIAYHAAKKVGKTCVVVAKNESEKLRLVVNHRIAPNDIIFKAQVDSARKGMK